MKKYLLILTAMFCSIVAMAQNTDAMLFGDVKANPSLTGKIIFHKFSGYFV